MINEEEEQYNFIKICGGINKAERLQQIWNNSYPHHTYKIFKPITREEDFKIQALKEGFTEQQIKIFLNLR